MSRSTKTFLGNILFKLLSANYINYITHILSNLGIKFPMNINNCNSNNIFVTKVDNS